MNAATTATTPRPLTDRQREVYGILWDTALRHGRQPTYREVADRLGVASMTAVLFHVRAIGRKGWIRSRGAPAGSRGGVEFVLGPDGRPFRGFSYPDADD